MSNRGLFTALLACALVLAALMLRSGDLALLALPLLAYLGVGILQSPSAPRLRAERTVSRNRVAASLPVEVQVSLANEGGLIRSLRVADQLPPSAQVVEGDAELLAALPAGGVARLSYVFRAPRGRYAWQSIPVVTGDPFDLFPVRFEIPAPGEVLARPTAPRLRHISLRPADTLPSPGSTPARLAGPGTDFWGVRPYQPGDSLRWINWRLSARHSNHFFTKEFEREEIVDIGLILDARPLAEQVPGEDGLFEHSVRATAALAESFLREGNRVSLLVSGETLTRLFPGYGKVQLNRILRCLAQTRCGLNFSLESIKYLPVRLFPSHSQIVVISPLAPDDGRIYHLLKSSGYSILLVSPDPVSWAALRAAPGAAEALSQRAARLERRLSLTRLLRMGVQVIDWQVDQPLSSAISAGLVRANLRARRSGGPA